jgi:hypothetical protein
MGGAAQPARMRSFAGMRGYRSRTIAVATACALAAPAVAATTLLAASPPKAGVYHGSLGGSRTKISISFRVSAGGADVEAMKISALPIYCSGNGPPGTPTILFQKAPITHTGKFATKGRDVIASGPLKGSVVATLAVSGIFTAAGSAHGTVATSYGGPAKSCSGTSSYTAHS